MLHAYQVPCFLCFVFNGVNAENSSLHIQIVVNGSSNDTVILVMDSPF
jgi:hypothetical protein